MIMHYLEFVTPDVDGVCTSLSTAVVGTFSAPEPLLGQARIAHRADGSMVGVRAPMHETETPIVRPYWLVDDIEQAFKNVLKAGATELHPPMAIPGFGRFAIFSQGGIQQGLWQR